MLILKCYLWEKPGDRAVVESVLNRLCVNPMQDKVNDVRAMAAELLNDLEKISRTAAEAVNFTYMPLNELAALQ